ncbi:TPR repeat containing protein [Oleiphilus messinensis]|uniref:TPR repeat containing protein n=1 Tax=Oleiphilus messinensis TaxID=141451 RepID=A0A1Y0I6Y6_9GAMM|nr:tetratricopeptide repeat protein [Oleiphilus messinensis]ARU55536.1 TPR repeat containing protein [Oleiphilus messinensis]
MSSLIVGLLFVICASSSLAETSVPLESSLQQQESARTDGEPLPTEQGKASAVSESVAAELEEKERRAAAASVESLEKPLYNPFVERYVLDELKQLRSEMANQKAELIQQIVDRELNSVDRGVTYATDTVTYFFYLIAGASSILVLVGWTSIREIKDRVHTLADEEISKLVHQYEERLFSIEQQLNQKTRHIEANREEIELTKEVQSLWLRAAQEGQANHKIPVYDQILSLRPDDCEALTYKADAVLELGEPQWAANLCHQALAIDPDNGHAFYQLACAYTAMKNYDEAVRFLEKAVQMADSYRDDIEKDEALAPLLHNKSLKDLL